MGYVNRLKVLAVVVTYNRANLLHRCLKHINEQVIVPNSILVVNNGSNDNTSEVIKNHNAIELLQENLGSYEVGILGLIIALQIILMLAGSWMTMDILIGLLLVL